MDILEMIKSAKDDNELRKVANAAIRYASSDSKKLNRATEYIGTNTDINPSFDIEQKLGEYFDCPVFNCYFGYIPKGMKIVYGTYFDTIKPTAANNGSYYYLDDESYVFDFFKFFKTREINDDYDIVLAVNDFLTIYFDKMINPMTREQIHTLLCDANGHFYPPVKEHSIRDFKGNGSALCSEYALIAENLLSLFGFDIIYLMDATHAYNIFTYGNEDDYKAYILDFSDEVEVFDINFHRIGMHPYIEEIPDANEDKLNALVNEGEVIELRRYFLQDINGTLYKHYLKETREYELAGITKQSPELTLVRNK